MNQARSFARECQVACSCSQGAVTSPKSSRGSRTGGYSSAAAAPLRGRPQATTTAARPKAATSSSFSSRRTRATTCQREPARRWASSSHITTSRSRSESGRASPAPGSQTAALVLAWVELRPGQLSPPPGQRRSWGWRSWPPAHQTVGCGSSPFTSNCWRRKWCTVLSSRQRIETSRPLASS